MEISISLGYILTVVSDLVVTDLIMPSFSVMILFYLATLMFYTKMFLHEI